MNEASQVTLVVKNLPGDAGLVRDAVSIPGSGRSPGERHENPLEYSCLENLMRIEAWWGTVHGVPKSQHNRLSTHVYNVVIVSAEQQRGLSHT